MKKVIDLINKEFKERKNLGGNWEAYEVEEYLEEIQTSLISKIKAIEVMRCCKSDSEQFMCECGESTIYQTKSSDMKWCNKCGKVHT